MGTVFRTTTLHARKDARKAFEMGCALARKEKYDEAVDEYEKAVRFESLFSAAWFELDLLSARPQGLGRAVKPVKFVVKNIQALGPFNLSQRSRSR